MKFPVYVKKYYTLYARRSNKFLLSLLLSSQLSLSNPKELIFITFKKTSNNTYYNSELLFSPPLPLKARYRYTRCDINCRIRRNFIKYPRVVATISRT